jgi:hypothetical protein
MNREGMSKILDDILQISAKKKEEKTEDKKEKALNVIKRFKDSKHPKHKQHVKKHVEMLEKGHEPKKVLKEFFKGLTKGAAIEDDRYIRQIEDMII